MDEMSRVHSDNQICKSHWIYVFFPFLVCFIQPVTASRSDGDDINKKELS